MKLLYIDPGTGSLLFTILIGLLGTAGYLLRNVFIKLRFLLSGGIKENTAQQNRIPFAIFSDHKRYWNTFEPICDEFEKRGVQLTFLTASPDDPALQKEYRHVRCEFIGEGNRAFAKLNFFKADVLLSTTPGLGVYQWKRSKDVKWYVHVLHMANDPTTYRMFGLDYYDAILLSGEYQIEQIRTLEKKRNLAPKELELVGVPYLDAMKRRFDASRSSDSHPTTLLLAPSWGSSSLLGRFGGDIIKAALNTGYHVIVRPHPQSYTAEKALIEKLMAEFPADEQLEWNQDNDNFDVLRRSDVMISDFSGAIFDFCLVFQKPVIYADVSFDKSPYDAWWIEDEMWTFKTLPRIGRQLTSENMHGLKKLVDELLSCSDYQEALKAAREETWVHVGEAASLVADYMIRKENELRRNESNKQQQLLS